MLRIEVHRALLPHPEIPQETVDDTVNVMMMMPLLRLFAIALLAAACTSQESGEALPPPVPIAQWSSRVDTLPGTYTRVMSPAEFHDSLLVVPDIAERLIWRINVNDGTRSAFGSQGGGPGEWARAGWAGKVSRDSVVIFQSFASAPFPVIDVVTGRGRTHALMSAGEGSEIDAIFTSVSSPLVRHADTLGRIYGAPRLAPPQRDPATGRMMPPIGQADTAPIVRYSLQSGGPDTLVRFRTGVQARAAERDVSGAIALPMSLGLYGPYNDWHVMRGGDLLVVDATTYTVQVRRAGASDVREFTLPWTPIAVSDSGWRAHVQNTTKGSIAMIEKSMADVSAKSGRSMTGLQPPRYVVPEKPATLSPVNFGGGVRRMHSSGSIAWIPVSRAEPSVTEFWDLVDIDRGARITTLEFPVNHRLLHVSSLGAYVVAKDADDLERILLFRP